ncbi:metallophosphoesterase [Desemzia sp. RIT804]|uniref:DNA repair exonuclease n=1 Tax=Desemzia sp. RIT 804 TaxID=2810209 RepID=UPI00194F07BE|nr:DNA repair exonuclease [Desemzia sp. RIT 804]MBM6613412.1 metallophosphoesterase [Desemzia sp. RIT 804]
MVQFIHAADLHLDSPFKGIKGLPVFIWEAIYQSTFQALTHLVDLAIEKQVDFICLAGDIYDGEDRSVKAQAYLKKEMVRLKEVNIPVYLIHGNHDFKEQDGLQLDMPDNVHIFQEVVETAYYETAKQERIALTGFSYNKRWINERKIADYPARSSTADYHIGLLHGYQEGNSSEHDKYAPFSLPELRSKHYDYWALGHIHKRQVLSEHPLMVYSGNTQGRNRTESGTKGCYLVTLENKTEKIDFFPLAPIQWKTVELSLKGKKSLQEVYQVLNETMSVHQNEEHSTLLAIELTDTGDLLEGVMRKIRQGDLLEGLQQVSKTIPFVFVVQLSIQSKKELNLPSLIQLFPDEWQQTLEELQEGTAFKETTQSFFEQQRLNGVLLARDEKYRKRIVQMAEQEIRQQLGHEGSVIDED